MYTAYTDSRFVTMFEHTNSRYLFPKAIERNQVDGYLREMEALAKAELDKTGADHVVYGIKHYNQDGTFVKFDVYLQPLNDGDFYSRTEAIQKDGDCRIYALHKRK